MNLRWLFLVGLWYQGDSFETHKIDGFECDLQEMEDVEVGFP